MKYLNLSKGFNPCNAEECDEIQFESFTFSGGEPHIKIKNDAYLISSYVVISTRLNNFHDLGLLAMAVDTIRSLKIQPKIDVIIPYFPGARQDRRMVSGEPLSVKVYADIINSLKLDSVTILDPHSDVTPALINNCIVEDNHEFVKAALWDLYDGDGRAVFYLVSPDAGANKKIFKLAESFDHELILRCDKTRDVKTGKLSGFEVYSSDLEKKDCIIVDDICDGGGTFIGLAEELKKKNAGNLYLIVTHGIFSRGFKELAKHFKRIYTTNSRVNDYAWDIPEIEKKSEIVKIINISI